jgi:hypothetical protein
MKTTSIDQELEGLKTVLHALEPLAEQQQKFVLKTVIERLGLDVPTIGGLGKEHRGGGGSAAGGGGAAASGSLSADGQTPNQLLKVKQPRTDVQRIACLAYYLTHTRGQPQFKTEDLINLNSEARGTRISNPWMSVSNATNQNKFLAPFGEGKKQITTLGEEVVEALPNQDAVKEVLKTHRKPRKRASKKTAK